MSKENFIATLQQAEDAHTNLINLVTTLNCTHREALKCKKPLNKESWQHDELKIQLWCSDLLEALNQIESSLKLVDAQHELRKIYNSRNIGNAFSGWRLWAENTLKTIKMRRQLSFFYASTTTIEFLERKMSDYREYLELVIARPPYSSNYFQISTALLLQHQALGELHTCCSHYIKRVSDLYRTAKTQKHWPEAQSLISKLHLHFQKQLKDTQRYEYENKEKIAYVDQIRKDVAYEEQHLKYELDRLREEQSIRALIAQRQKSSQQQAEEQLITQLSNINLAQP